MLRELHLSKKTRWRGICRGRGNGRGKTKSQEGELVDDVEDDDWDGDEVDNWSLSLDAEDE